MFSYLFSAVNKVKGILLASHLITNIAKISILSSANFGSNVVFTKLTNYKILENDNIQRLPSELFYKYDVLKNFANFTGKHLCWSLFLNKNAGDRPATLLKGDSDTAFFTLILRNF